LKRGIRCLREGLCLMPGGWKLPSGVDGPWRSTRAGVWTGDRAGCGCFGRSPGGVARACAPGAGWWRPAYWPALKRRSAGRSASCERRATSCGGRTRSSSPPAWFLLGIVVGWQLAANMRTTLVLDALRMALGLRERGADVALVAQTGAGSQSTPLPSTPRRSTTTRCSRRSARSQTHRTTPWRSRSLISTRPS
jgi:hypothetical protein